MKRPNKLIEVVSLSMFIYRDLSLSLSLSLVPALARPLLPLLPAQLPPRAEQRSRCAGGLEKGRPHRAMAGRMMIRMGRGW
eukprot:6476422-Pyramimonas_sp.AAC.1